MVVLYRGSPFNTCTNCKHYSLSFTAPYIPIAKTRGFTAQPDKMLAKLEKVVIAAESGKKIAALAAMYASERGYSFIPVANDDLSTYLAKQQQKGCVMFDGAENEREIENTCRKLRIPLRRCKLEGA